MIAILRFDSVSVPLLSELMTGGLRELGIIKNGAAMLLPEV